MRRRPDHTIRNLLIASLIILAAMHPNTVGQLTQLGTELVLAVIGGIATAAQHHEGEALLTAGLLYIAYQAHTHRPRARAHH